MVRHQLDTSAGLKCTAMLPRTLGTLVVCLAFATCDSPSPPDTGDDGGSVQTIRGTERLGWNQTAGDANELASYQYAIYVDGVRAELTGTNCSPAGSGQNFSCSAPLPPLSSGQHTLQVATFSRAGGSES